jgi:hypothetical protein
VPSNRIEVPSGADSLLAIGGLRSSEGTFFAERLDDFLQTLLGSANPDTGPGRDLKVVQVLDQASANLDHELAGEPVLLAQAHLTIGQAYAGLREARPAITHLRTALEIDRRVYGEENLVTARVKAALGSALRRAGTP